MAIFLSLSEHVKRRFMLELENIFDIAYNNPVAATLFILFYCFTYL